MDLPAVTEQLPASSLLEGAEPFRDGDVWLAGGTFLFSEPQPGVRRLVDLSSLGWEPVTEDDDGLDVAATCTVTELAAWGAAARGRLAAAALVEQCADAFLAGWKVQGVATVGGNVATALPAAPMVSLLAALDGVAELWPVPAGAGASAGSEEAPGRRLVPVAELVTGDHATALAPGELLRRVRVPAAALAARTAFRRASLTPLGRSASLVVARRDPGGGVVLTLTAAVRAPLQLRWPSTEAAAGADEELDAAVDGSSPRRTWHDDVHGHPAWRRATALRQAREAVAELAST